MDDFILPQTSGTMTLLFAPPSWGKTRTMIRQLKLTDSPMVFIAPLRALAEEVYASFSKAGITCAILRNRTQAPGIWEAFCRGHAQLLVSTPELLTSHWIEVAAWRVSPVFVLDEFHLYFYWGEGFRPVMGERLVDIAVTGKPVWGLTATLQTKFLQRWREQALLGFDQLIEVDVGRGRFQTPPKKHHYYPGWGKRALEKHFYFLVQRRPGERCLLFCRYRREVFDWVARLRRRGIKALGCVGGEVQQFQRQLRIGELPQVIVATTCLGHGVNLPRFHRVFISYPVQESDLWLQMAARGGRRGEAYELYSMNPYQMDWKRKLMASGKLLVRGLFHRLGAIFRV